MNPIPIYEMFPFLRKSPRLAADYTQARVTSVTVNNTKTQMDINLSLESPVPPYEIAVLEELISGEYGMDTVNVEAAMKAAAPAAANGNAPTPPQGGGAGSSGKSTGDGAAGKAAGTAAKKSASKAIMGRVTKTEPKPMSGVTIDDGTVTVRGFVCAVRSRVIEKNGAFLLAFDMTDYTNTISVNKFMRDDSAQRIADEIKKGMYITVSGTLSISNYDGELTLSPQNIFESQSDTRSDDEKEKRAELHLHTRMSATDALTDIKEVVARASDWGHSAIAITDHGVVHAFPEAAAAAEKAAMKGKPVKIIYGMEGYLRNDTAQEGTPTVAEGAPPTKGHIYHIIILAKNRTGLRNLYELVTKSHVEHFYKRPLIFKSILEQYREGLILGSACEGGELFQAVVSGKDGDELKKIAEFYDYLEIQPLCNNMFMLSEEKHSAKSTDDLRGYNRKIAELGESMGIPVAATTDAHFLDPEDEIYRRIILMGKGYDRADEELPLYFRTTREMLDEFGYLGAELAYKAVVTNTNKIADMCEAITPLPPEKKLCPPKLPGSAEELENLVLSNLPELYGDPAPPAVIKRIDDELNDILKLGYDVIYIAAQRLVAYLREEGSRVGSRGSVGSSFVAYIAGITEVNPLAAHYRCPKCRASEFPSETGAEAESYACGADMPDKECPACGTMYIKDGFNIPFETFLGFNGEKIPDIDLNISGGEYSKKAQKFVYDMFGSDNVFRAGTIGTIAEKTAFGFVKKYMEDTGKTASKAEENRLVAGCLGVKQTTGQHPGGLIVIPQDRKVTEFCPVQHPSDDKEKGVVTTHFDYHAMEDYLLKLDMLGHDNPTMLVMLENMTGINADGIRLDDPGTMSVFSSPVSLGLPEDDEIIGKTGAIGIPEFGTVIARKMLCDTLPENFDTLIRLSGYAHGTNVWFGNARELILTGVAKVSETISSRDDIMLYLISKGMDAKIAFDISEGVRKGRGLTDEAEREMRSLGVPAWYMDSCKKITYLFPRAHAAAYVIMAFRIAWFKVHRPIEYYSAHFYRRSHNNAFDAVSMTRGIDAVKAKIRELKKRSEAEKNGFTKKDEELMVTLESCYEFYMRGFDFLGIDLYKSDAEKFIPETGADGRQALRPPLIAISGLGITAALSIAKNREGRTFVSIQELSAACPGVNKNHIEQLGSLGALGDMPETSQMSLF